MIRLQQLSLQRGTQLLLQDADLTIHAGQRIGVVGANGTGKSSLFKLLLGELQPDAGELRLPPDLRIAHMAQEVAALERPALDYVLDGDQPLRTVQRQLAEAERSGDAHRQAELHDRLEALDGYTARSRAEQLLHGLGFRQEQLQQPVRAFSGGWRIRLNLAQALMTPSDLLLLDEPTNHLDLDATLWLEGWLKQYPGTLLLISHDREFLDAVVSHIVHLDHRRLQLYRGDYSAFERQRAERLAQQQASYAKQQQRIAEIEQFVRRFRAKASKAKQAQSRLKELERMERIAPAHVDSPFQFSFPAADKVSNPLLSLRKATLGYDTPLLQGVNLRLHPGARLGLLGPNGAGKSTLIKSLVGDLPLLAGARETGEHLSIGYFAQHQLEALDLQASPLLHIQRLSPTVAEQQARDFLGGFGFQGDDALATVGRFSGGEKARLALALLAWQKPNVLLLDEPTNHLDLEMRHALTLALQAFSGAMILVSHDRHLLRNTVDEFILVAHQQVQPFAGDLSDYQQWLNEHNSRSAGQPQDDKTPQGPSAAERKELRRLAAQKRERLRPLKKRLQQLEAELERQQAALAELEQQLAAPELYAADQKARLQELLQRQGKLQQQAEQTEEAWLSLSEELEALAADS